ncbi:MAG: GDSL-type esterase/lipase family protein [Porticoccaceae bacterium]|nr:GDSL-type esterase/lipase family protein [Porticoccaceae bacterium]
MINKGALLKSVALLYLLLLTACGNGGSSTPSPQPQAVTSTPAAAAPPVSGQNKVTQTIDGQRVDRTYLIRYPETLAEKNYPAVLFFHGDGGFGEEYLNNNPDIEELIDSGKFIGIFPDGYNQRWNVSGETNADDVGFVSLIVNNLGSDERFNLNKVYGVGISNGAGLVNKLAKETSMFAGIAPLISQQTVSLGQLVPNQAVSVFQFNGAMDDLVPFNGGTGVAENIFMSAQESAENWASNFNCDMAPSNRTRVWGEEPVEEFTFTGCLNNKKIRYFVAADLGHSTSFGESFSLYTLIWSFFRSTDRDNVLNLKLLSLGDSYTIGQAVCDTCSFPEQLKESLVFEYSDRDTLNLQVIAKTGWTTTDLKTAIVTENPAADFDLVTLLIGVNNQVQNRPFEIYEAEFIELVESAISFVGGDANKLTVVSIPDYAFTPFGEFRNPFSISSGIDLLNDYARNYCEENGLTYVYITDITRQGLEDPMLVAPDRLHPSALAYSKFVERLLPVALEKLQ